MSWCKYVSLLVVVNLNCVSVSEFERADLVPRPRANCTNDARGGSTVASMNCHSRGVILSSGFPAESEEKEQHDIRILFSRSE